MEALRRYEDELLDTRVDLWKVHDWLEESEVAAPIIRRDKEKYLAEGTPQFMQEMYLTMMRDSRMDVYEIFTDGRKQFSKMKDLPLSIIGTTPEDRIATVCLSKEHARQVFEDVRNAILSHGTGQFIDVQSGKTRAQMLSEVDNDEGILTQQLSKLVLARLAQFPASMPRRKAKR